MFNFFQRFLQWLKSLFLPLASPAVPLFEPSEIDNDESEDDMSNLQLLSEIRPISLRAGSTVTANSDAEVAAGPLTNSSGEPMEIHEFIFSVKPVDSSVANFGSSGLFPTGGQFAIGLAVKDGTDFGYAMTNGVIPLWSFGQARQLGQEEIMQAIYQSDTAGKASFFTSVYCWKLDHPLYVPPGARIIPTIRALGAFNGDVDIGITAIGKILPNTPASRPAYKVPWVCSYLTKSFGLTEAGEDSSAENALYNPFPDRPVTIERFVGRFHIFTTFDFTFNSATITQSTVLDVSQFDPLLAAGAQPAVTGNNYYSRFMSIRMRDSVGNPLVREKTLFRSVFESATRTWECRHVLPPRQYHKVDFYKTAAEATDTFASRIQTSVASIGWREVSWKRA